MPVHLLTLICDDIRSELGNKLSLMGLYDESIILSPLPATLAKISFFQRWEDAVGTRFVRITFGGSAMNTEHAVEGDIDEKKARLQFQVGLAPFHIAHEGVLAISTYFNHENRPSYVRTLSVIRADESDRQMPH